MPDFVGTPTKSDQYTLQATGGGGVPSRDVSSKLRVSYFSYTHTAAAGAGTGEVNLVRLPAGRVRVLSDLSWLVTSAFAAGADLHIGFREYTEPDGTVIAEDDNAFADNLDAGGGALDQAWPLPAAGFTEFNSRDGVLLYSLIDAGNIEAADTIQGYVVFQQGN